jgi:hypothetical protein
MGVVKGIEVREYRTVPEGVPVVGVLLAGGIRVHLVVDVREAELVVVD